MDRVIVDGGFFYETSQGLAFALLTVLLCAIPLCLVGVALLRRLPAAAPAPPAVHGLARFALTLLTVNACLLMPVTGALALVPEGRAAWPLLTFLLLSCLADAIGAHAWLAILHRSEHSRPLSPLAE